LKTGSSFPLIVFTIRFKYYCSYILPDLAVTVKKKIMSLN